jgi:hypothetical protein
MDRALRIGVFCAALILLATFVSNWRTDGSLEVYRPVIAVPLILFAASPAISAWWAATRLFKERPTRAIGGRVNAQGITLLSKMAPGKQRQIAWQDFLRAGHTEALTGLLAKDGTLWVFQRDFFTRDGDWDRFRQLVKKNISISK